ncbi:hypothetical protein PIB30_089327, partial [Stylosanthes scabra]|nr:hypothetical protein [Stylosanthes scabra]
DYETWVQHGEWNDSDLTRFGLGGYNASNDDPAMNSWSDNVLGMNPWLRMPSPNLSR